MASLTRGTWVWASSRSWWWTGKPGVLHAVHGGHRKFDKTERLNWLNVTHIIGSWFVSMERADLEPWIFSHLMMLVPGVPLDSISLKNRSGKYLIYCQQSLEGRNSFTFLLPYSGPVCCSQEWHSQWGWQSQRLRSGGERIQAQLCWTSHPLGPLPLSRPLCSVSLCQRELDGGARGQVLPLSALKCLFLLAEGGLQSS